MGTDELVSDLMVELDGKVSIDQLNFICNQVRMCAENYSITRKITELAVPDRYPKELDIFLVSKKIEGRSLSTLSLYKARIEHFFDTVKKSLSEITSNDVRLYLYNYQKLNNISDRTLDGFRLVLSSFFNWCFNESYIKTNPSAPIHCIHYDVKPREPLSDIEMESLRKGCVTPRDSAIVETLYCTGCRCSELTNLDISDVNLLTREVKLFGKGKKYRSSYLSARGVLAIKEYIDSRDDNNQALFVRTRNPHSRLDNSGVEWIVRCISRRSGVENVYPHRIRHTFATDALDSGMNITDLQALLGHASVDTTLIYAKVKPQSVRNAHTKYVK